MAPAGGSKPPRRKRRQAGRTKSAGEQPLPIAEDAAATAGDSGPQTTELREAEEARDLSTSSLAAQPPEQTAIEARAAEPQPEAFALDAEPLVQAEAAGTEVAEVEATAAVAEPAQVEAEAAAAEPAEVQAVAAATAVPVAEAGAASAQPVPEPPAEATPTAAAVAPAQAPAERGLYELLWGTGLLTVAAVAQRELAALLVWPIAYVAWALVIVLTSIFGYLPQVNAGAPVSMTGVFSWLALMMAFFVPLCTMRLLAGEQRSGSLEMLLTSPIRFWELVAGKWLGGFLFYVVTISFTLVYVMFISAYQQPQAPATILGVQVSLPSVDYGPVITGYAGILLVGAAWVALGVLASSLTQNQIVAAIVGVGALVVLQYGFGALAGVIAPPLSDLLDYLAASSRAQSFNEGQIVLRDLVYFATLTLGALFIATRVVESRTWR